MARRRRDPEPAWELDLHGRTVERALELARHELFVRWKRGQSPGLLITGKGLHAADGKGRLYEAIKQLVCGPGAPELGPDRDYNCDGFIDGPRLYRLSGCQTVPPTSLWTLLQRRRGC